MDLRFAKAYGEPAEFEQALLNTVNYAVEKYSIPQTASLEVILMSHGNAAGYMEAQECDNYLQKTDAFSNRLIAFLESNFTWQGQFEAVHGATEMSEGSSDPPGPGKPFGDRMSVGEQTDSAINGKYVNALGQVVDNGENNFDYIVTVHMLFESESSDTTYRIQQNNLGNNVLMSDEYRRSKLDKDGTEYDAGDVDSEYFTSKIFDATGWPSTPGCLEDSDCALNNPTVYKGSATKPTRIIMSGTVLSLDTGPLLWQPAKA